MRSTNKILALLLSLALVIGVFTACQPESNETLQSETYAANVQILFSSDDEAMKKAIEDMQNSSVIYVDGDDIKVETNASVGTTTITDKYTYFSGNLYHEQVVSSGDMIAKVLERTGLKDETRDQLLNDMGAGASITPLDFNVQNMEGDDKNYTYTCSRITTKAKESLEKIYGARFAGFGRLSLDSAEYVLEGQGGRDEKSTLTCNFVIIAGESTYNITMQIITDYDYDASFSITAPANSSSYKQVLYSEMFD
jgi:hypothetical protein